MDWIVLWWVKDSILSVSGANIGILRTYRHLSSTTLITGRMPLPPSFGVGTPARDPSPRKSVPSSHFVLHIVSARDCTARYMNAHLCRFSNCERSDSNWKELVFYL